MKYERILPADFDGTFKFTNDSDEEFVGKWGGREYHFPPRSTSPMIMPDHSPLEIQNIRKKFAKDWAEKQYFKSDKYEAARAPEGTLGNRTMSGIHTAATYTLDDLKENIQRCLKPLEIKKAFVQESETVNLENVLTKDDEGNLNTIALDKKTSLKQRALEGKGLPQN